MVDDSIPHQNETRSKRSRPSGSESRESENENELGPESPELSLCKEFFHVHMTWTRSQPPEVAKVQ